MGKSIPPVGPLVAMALATIAIAAGAQTTHTPSVAAPAAALSPEHIFTDNCAACHQEDGKGIPGAFPALAGDKFVLGSATSAIKVVLDGRAGMPTFKADMTDEQIAAALTHVRKSWGNAASPVTTAGVTALRTGAAPIPAHQKPMDAH